MATSSDIRFYLAIVLTPLVLPFQAVILSLCWRLRVDPSMKLRFPSKLLVSALYYLVLSLILLAHEITTNASGNPSFPCFLTLIASVLYIPFGLLLPLSRIVRLILAWNPQMRVQSSYSILLQSKGRKIILLSSLLIAILFFSLVIGLDSNYQTLSSDSSSFCGFLDYYYVYFGIVVLSILLCSSALGQLSEIQDSSAIGTEIRSFCAFSLGFIVLELVLNLIRDLVTERSEQLEAAIHFIAIGYAVLQSYLFLLRPILHLGLLKTRSKVEQIVNGTEKVEKTEKTHREDERTAPTIQLPLPLGVESRTGIPILIPPTSPKAGLINEDSFGAGSHLTPSGRHAELRSILEDSESLALFESHAKRLWCQELVLYWKAAHAMLQRRSERILELFPTGARILTAELDASLGTDFDTQWRNDAKALYDQYILEGAALQINISADLRGKFESFFAASHLTSVRKAILHTAQSPNKAGKPNRRTSVFALPNAVAAADAVKAVEQKEKEKPIEFTLPPDPNKTSLILYTLIHESVEEVFGLIEVNLLPSFLNSKEFVPVRHKHEARRLSSPKGLESSKQSKQSSRFTFLLSPKSKYTSQSK